MAQAFGVTDIFEKDTQHLIQEIEIKQQKIFKPPAVTLPLKPEYDGRLMTKPPSRRSSMMDITELLEPHIMLGLKLSFSEERWQMAFGKKTDDGTLRMPLRHVLHCAERIMR